MMHFLALDLQEISVFLPSRRILSSLRATTVVAASLATLIISGCGAMEDVSPSSAVAADTTGGAIGGTLIGGQNPISGAKISLWVAGYTGYGSGPVSGTFLQSTTTDSAGHFSFPTSGTTSTYTCPTATTSTPQLVYIVADGGDSGSGTPNTAIKMMAILAGPAANGALTSSDACATLRAAGANTTVYINEISTVVAINALAQFYNPTTNYIGTSATNYLGLTNAFNLASSIMPPSSNSLPATFSPAGQVSISGTGTSNTAKLNVTGTPEYDKTLLIADIIAACVNTAGPTGSTVTPDACDTLFADAVPPPSGTTSTSLGSGFSFPTATNTLQAAYYLCVNPINASTAGVPDTGKMSALYGLAAGVGAPFVNSASQPTDWTLGVTYGSTAYLNATTYAISAPLSLQIDFNGSAVFLGSSAAFPTGTSISSLNAYGGLQSANNGSVQPLQGLTLDTLVSSVSNVGYTTKVSTKTTYSTHSSGITNAALLEDAGSSNLSFAPSSYAADGKYLFFTSLASADTGSVFQVPLEGQTSTPFTSTTATTLATYAVNNTQTISGLTASSPMVVDAASNVWLAAGNTVYKIPYNSYPSSGVSGATPTTPVGLSGTFVTPAGLAVDHSNNVWITNAAGGTPANGYIAYYSAANGTVTADATNNDGGVNNPAGVAVDGGGNVWVASAGQTSSFTGQTVSEFALVGGTLTPMSPSNGFAHTYSKPGTIAVDISGNVWIANTGTYATATVPGTITQILGAAVPTIAPLAAGIKNNTLATLP